MNTRLFAAVAASLLTGMAILAPPASAKTVKACRAEWQAQKAAMQAAGKTEKAYIAECHTVAAAPAAAAPSPDKGDKGSNY